MWLSKNFSASLLAICAIGMLALQASAQQPSVVQPGAPGQATRELPASTRAVLPARSAKDIDFMQGMIMHHQQAVDMTALIDARTDNKELRLLGARIKQSQSDEMNFMRRWLTVRGESAEHKMPAMKSSEHQHTDHSKMNMAADDQMLMPGMLTAKQMEALAKAKGADFDRLFLTGMIQHHNGALIMVKELFDTAGSGQDAEIFGFATDVDSGQRAEIRIMETMLGKNP
jgi:uncharacterized protein (DUF305 family)